ncbi:MAG TPA: hemerythrin domain-containing protein [Mycobacteriales bacterium]
MQHDIEEHQQLEETMKKLESLDAADPQFLQALGRLESVLRDHVQDEETEQFPQLRARVPREQLVAMAGKVTAAKKVAPTRPHPGAPHSALFHKVVGPGVGMVDRLRDKLTGRCLPGRSPPGASPGLDGARPGRRSPGTAVAGRSGAAG